MVLLLLLLLLLFVVVSGSGSGSGDGCYWWLWFWLWWCYFDCGDVNPFALVVYLPSLISLIYPHSSLPTLISPRFSFFLPSFLPFSEWIWHWQAIQPYQIVHRCLLHVGFSLGMQESHRWVCVRVCMYVYMCMCVFVCVYVCVCMSVGVTDTTYRVVGRWI